MARDPSNHLGLTIQPADVGSLISQLADARDASLFLVGFPFRLRHGLFAQSLGADRSILRDIEEFDGFRSEWQSLMSKEARNLIQTTDLERFEGSDSIAVSVAQEAINSVRDPMMEFASKHQIPRLRSGAMTTELWSAISSHFDASEFIMSKIGDGGTALRFRFNDRINLEFNAAIKELKRSERGLSENVPAVLETHPGEWPLATVAGKTPNEIEAKTILGGEITDKDPPENSSTAKKFGNNMEYHYAIEHDNPLYVEYAMAANKDHRKSCLDRKHKRRSRNAIAREVTGKYGRAAIDFRKAVDSVEKEAIKKRDRSARD